MITRTTEDFMDHPLASLTEIYDKFKCQDNFCPTDLFTSAIINRAMSLNEAYCHLCRADNYTSAIPYIRMQMDNSLTCYGGFLVDDQFAYINHIIGGNDLYKFKAKKGSPLFEKYIVQEINKAYPGFKRGYQSANDDIHLSNKHFQAAFYGQSNNHLKFAIEDYNYYADREKEYYNNSMFIANNILIDILTKFYLPFKKACCEYIDETSHDNNRMKAWKEFLEEYPNILNLLCSY